MMWNTEQKLISVRLWARPLAAPCSLRNWVAVRQERSDVTRPAAASQVPEGLDCYSSIHSCIAFIILPKV